VACRAVATAKRIDLKPPAVDGQADALRLIAHTSGFRTRRIRLGLGWWRAKGEPLLGYLAAGNRPVALLPATTSGYVLLDPCGAGPTTVTADVASKLKPMGFMFYRTRPSEHSRALGLLRFCLPVVRRELKALVLVGLLGALLGVAAPVATGIVVGDAIPRADYRQLASLCTALFAAGLSVATFQAIQGVALARIRGKLESDLLIAAWDHLFNLPTRFFGRYESGELALRALGLGRAIEVLTITSLASLLLALFSLINLGVLLAYSLKLGLLAIGLLAISPLATLAALHPLWRLQRLAAHHQGEISSFLFLLLTGIPRLRIAGQSAGRSRAGPRSIAGK
jgi:ATP-binding cassette subfamily C protein